MIRLRSSGAGPAGQHPPLADRIWAQWCRRRWRGFHRAWRACRGPGGRLQFRARHGALFALDPYGYIDGIVLGQGYYESEVLDALRAELVPGAVLWDVGANFGLHGITAAVLQPAATVVAFEPNPAEHERLVLHRAWNAPQLRVSRLALFDRSGVLPLRPGPPHNSGMAQLETGAAPGGGEAIFVSAATGDELIAQGLFPAPTLMKIDVEGHETAVLRGLAATLAGPRCRLVVFEDAPDTSTPSKNELCRQGFVVEPLRRREASSHRLANFAARKPPLRS